MNTENKLEFTQEEQSNELVILAKESGLEVSKQNQIVQTLSSFFNKAKEWDATIKSIVITSPEETGKMKMAREGRLTLKNIRLEAKDVIEAKRNEVKYAMNNFTLEDKLWLKEWQMMEAIFKNLETQLEEKEKFKERWDANEKEKIKSERIEKLLPFEISLEYYDLLNMSNEAFEQLYNSTKLAYETKIAEGKKAEEQRLAKIKAEAEENERIRKENERLKIEAEAKQKEAEIERKKQAEILAKEKEKADKERKEAEEKARKEKELSDKKLAEQKAEADKKLKLEKEAKAKLEKELQDKKDAENLREKQLKAVEDAKIKKQKELQKAPDKEKLREWLNDCFLGITPSLVDAKSHTTACEIHKKHTAFLKWATELINNI